MRMNISHKTFLLLSIVGLSSCAQHHLVTADKAYARMAYDKAACSYEKAFKHIDDRDAALRAADAYNQQNELAKAADWYAFADRVRPLDGAHALAYGRVLQSLGRIPQAAKQFERVLSEKPEDAVVRELGLAIASRDAFYVDTTLYTVRPLTLAGITSAFGGQPIGNNILFTGERVVTPSKANPWNGASFLDLYTASPGSNGTWGAPVPLPGTVNGRFHDGPATVSADGKTMFLTRSDYLKFRLNKDDGAVSHLMLFQAKLQADGTWGELEPFPYNGADFSAGHAALSADGRSLYYISDMPGGLGGTDIYRCDLQADGSWGYPRNMGHTVNTSAQEMFPTVHGDTVYFASNGHRTIGGLDIFRTYLQGDAWTTPENLNYPLNTPFDDFALHLLPSGDEGYLSSDRTGRDQVHFFHANDPTLVLNGRFTDDASDEVMASVEVKLLDLTTGEELTAMTDADGSYSFPLKKGHDYRVQGGKDGMFTESRNLSTKGQRISRTYEEHFQLKAVVVDRPIVIENIYYDYDRWDIRAEAAAELDKLVRLFNDNPGLSFELSSHTDSRATDMYNLVLSEARANSAVDYLIRQGMDPQRIKAKGYGERQLVNRCKDDVECSEEEHQANRRTEFKVTSIAKPIP